MPVTVLGPTSDIPYATFPTLVQVRQHWGDDWTTVRGLYLESCSRSAGGHDLDECTLTWKYGHLAHPWDAAKNYYAPLNLDDYWVQVLLELSESSQQLLWIGRVYGQGKVIEGAQSSGPSGHQRWQCYGPQMILRKQMVSRALWTRQASSPPAGDNWCTWLPPMNDRLGKQAWLVGNRSSTKYGGVYYVYGGTDLWTAYDYAEYLLARFCNFSASGGPTFALGGQATLLQDLKLCEEWPDTISVDAMLRRLIAPKLGVDFSIEYDSGSGHFLVNVFALQSSAVSAGGVTLPANPNTVKIIAGVTPANLSTHVALSSDHRASKIRVLGKRVVLCGTVGGPDADSAWHPGALAVAWDTALSQHDYDSGNAPSPDDTEGLKQFPWGSAQAADYARRNPRFRDVYSLYLSPKSFDLNSIHLAIGLDGDGAPSIAPGGGAPTRQNFLKKTLHWLPLQANQDYSTWPPTALTLGSDPDYAPQFLPPQIYLHNDTEKYRVAEKCGVHVVVPPQGLGLRLVVHPNHLVGKGVFPDDANTLHQPRWAGRELVATLAWETDARLSLEYAVPDSDPVDGVMEIKINDAEMWLLAANTALGVKPAHADQLVASPNSLQILRDDRPRLGMVLAGAIARYAASRARAEIVAAGICPWGGLLGQILSTIESGGDSTGIDAPITKITWQNALDGGLPRTILRTGFASSE